jgi:hypothetical protein
MKENALGVRTGGEQSVQEEFSDTEKRKGMNLQRPIMAVSRLGKNPEGEENSCRQQPDLPAETSY